ncbi:terminase family protein [Sodalis endosymbiont of Spalangia cameroni]|uniref:terminase large subunit domain-containing protein n=1 Tax=Sodalis praecaptivus TaxID=1239307 RepID=UPI0031F74030
MAKYSDELITVARSLYLRHMTPGEIARELNLPNARVVYYWADKGGWADLLSHESLEEVINRRVQLLTLRDNKTDSELQELDSLLAHYGKLRVQASKHAEKLVVIAAGRAGVETGAQAGDEGRTKKRKYRKNDISGLSQADFDDFVNTVLFGYQRHLRLNMTQNTRNILKCRQAGLTWYFAFEALENAVMTGEPQIFLSASRPQAEVFRSHIVTIAQQYFGVRLTGNPIRLSNGAELRFLSTNSNTAQSYSGHLYIDEYFWIQNFTRLNEVASAMATHDRWRTTYFSTPSSKAHQAYPFWTGETWQRGDAKRKKITFPAFDELRDGGRLCPDGQWRYVITLEDAIAGGFNLASLERLRNKYPRDTFNMLYQCQFVDSGDSVFSFGDLERCGVETARWQDHHPNAARPFGNREVWAGFDPARSGDTSTFVIMAPPQYEGERFRVLATFYWQGMNWKYQASQIKALFARYHMTHIGIDTTGIGSGVFEMVEAFAPRQTVAIRYGVETKNRLVLKMVDLVESQRIEWDGEQKEIAASFLAIRRTSTAKGGGMTFIADRSQETGHADVFFALSHAADNEPLNYENPRRSIWKMSQHE